MSARPAIQDPPETAREASRAGLWTAIFLPYAVGYFLSYLLRNVNAVLAPEFQRTMGLSSADLGLLTGAYLAAFALAQLPIGVLLDRYGPRRVQMGLLLVAAAGCGAFALGTGLGPLILARGLIGLGVSGCLMAAFKAFSQWFPADRQASLNAAIMISGGLGALTASTPFSWLEPLVGWRWIFAGLMGVAVLTAVLILRMPDQPIRQPAAGLAGQLAELKSIQSSDTYWSAAPMAAMMIGGFIAIQGLWAMPWLTTVSGLPREDAALYLLLLNVALMAGYAAMATQLRRALRRGLSLAHILTIGGAAALATSLALVLNPESGYALWLLLGLAFSSTNLIYAHHASAYPPSFAGRANTSLNLGVFIGGFGLQWGFGMVVDAAQDRGLPSATALPLAWGLLIGLQAASLLWFFLSGRKLRSRFKS
ncbi:MAG TPA: MFS transporter [Rhodocyclaceae bacterium]|nr:MFS transporter [Rhodocyclaceae bacterium]